MKNKTDHLFSISQAAKSCNLSRSTLLRLEDRGLLAPAYTDPDSGRRHYDIFNICRILQIQKFQSMGFTTEETISYYAGQGEAQNLLSIIEEKLSALQESLEEMLLRTHNILICLSKCYGFLKYYAASGNISDNLQKKNISLYICISTNVSREGTFFPTSRCS